MSNSTFNDHLVLQRYPRFDTHSKMLRACVRPFPSGAQSFFLFVNCDRRFTPYGLLMYRLCSFTRPLRTALHRIVRFHVILDREYLYLVAIAFVFLQSGASVDKHSPGHPFGSICQRGEKSAPGGKRNTLLGGDKSTRTVRSSS